MREEQEKQAMKAKGLEEEQGKQAEQEMKAMREVQEKQAMRFLQGVRCAIAFSGVQVATSSEFMILLLSIAAIASIFKT